MQTSVAPDINAATLPPEMSRVVRLDDITPTANTLTLDATVHECMALAARFELPYVRSLSAEITYRRTRGGQMVRMDGRITAAYGQLCGMTLASMPLVMEESFQTEYTLDPWEKYSEFDLDQPEILTDDFIDVGEVVAEYFGLGIDPYAARTGAERLPELARYLSDAVKELLASGWTPPGEDLPAAVAVPQDNVAADPVEEVIEFLTSPPAPSQIQAANMDIPLITDDPPAAEQAAEDNLVADDPPPHESLFMKYLRKLRAA